METPYKTAWQDFANSPEFHQLIDGLIKDPPTNSVYASNRMRVAFDAGWNAASDVANKNAYDKSQS